MLRDDLVHAAGAGVDTAPDIREAQSLETPLESTVLAWGAMKNRKHDLNTVVM